MFLEVNDMKKSYGENGSYIQVLKGISMVANVSCAMDFSISRLFPHKIHITVHTKWKKKEGHGTWRHIPRSF
nr:hypothetical protein [uncultured Blautia sp.]